MDWLIIHKELFEIYPYKFNKKDKKVYFSKGIENLTNFHRKKCKEYNKILNGFNFKNRKNNELLDYPFLPTKIFKNFDLKSVSENKIIKRLVSSGTTGQLPSKIYLDKENANNQKRALNKIMSTLLGNERLPMLIVDQNPRLNEKSVLNARAVAIFGFSIFGKEHSYLLNKNFEIDYKTLNSFLEKNGNKKFLIFGFTSLIYENLIK